MTLGTPHVTLEARSLTLEVYGVRLLVRSGSPSLLTSLRRDFSYFASEGGSAIDVTVDAHLAAPPWEDAPETKRSIVHADFVAYDVGAERWVDYQGAALSRWDFRRERGEVWSTDPSLLHELVYLLLLSRMGELHDRRGIHRAHALGLRCHGQGVLCFLPSGGGKTTLGLAALGLPGVELLSDDTPLVTRSGELLAFPTRIGTGHLPDGVSPTHVRSFARRKHGTKWLLDADPYDIARHASPSVILLGHRQLRGDPAIAPASKGAAASELFRSVVVGYGLPQVVEYFLRWDLRDAIAKARFVASRTQACAALLRRSRVHHLRLSRDSSANARALLAFLTGLAHE